MSEVIGIDIGGANTKIASADGDVALIRYVPLWKDSSLPLVLKEISDKLDPDKVGVVMTGELADCFRDKKEGVEYIMKSVKDAFGPGRHIRFLDNSGRFTGGEDPCSLAAANWMASALYVGSLYKDCIFVDTGSTTTDIIPVINGMPLAAKTDFERLKRDELIYSGVLRTNLAALTDRIMFDGIPCRVSSELFSITGDVYLLLGRLPEDEYTCETPDGGGRDIEAAMRRIARIVCADHSEVTEKDISGIAEQIFNRQAGDLAAALLKISNQYSVSKIVGCGLGEFLIEHAVGLTGNCGFCYESIAKKYVTGISKVFPAFAVARLIEEEYENTKSKPLHPGSM